MFAARFAGSAASGALPTAVVSTNSMFNASFAIKPFFSAKKFDVDSFFTDLPVRHLPTIVSPPRHRPFSRCLTVFLHFSHGQTPSRSRLRVGPLAGSAFASFGFAAAWPESTRRSSTRGLVSTHRTRTEVIRVKASGSKNTSATPQAIAATRIISRASDKTIARFDEYMMALRGCTALASNFKFKLFRANGTQEQHVGAYILTDNGYHRWRVLQSPVAHPATAAESLWTENVESMRKDVGAFFCLIRVLSLFVMSRSAPG